jgi:hypothetical protein
VLGAWDSDPDNGIIAYLSERGLAILDKKIGDEVEFPLGTGEKVRRWFADDGRLILWSENSTGSHAKT